MRALTVTAAASGLILVAAGAAGAHLVAGGTGAIETGDFRTVEDIMSDWIFPSDRWNSALLYGFGHTLAALITARTLAPGAARAISAWAFMAGVILFSGVQIATLLWASFGPGVGLPETPFTPPPTPLDMLSPLVPVGGLSFMAGWIALGVAALTAPAGKP